MIDKRELILARLLAIANNVAGVKKAWRHKGRLSETARPAIVILDADEAAEITDPPSHSPRAPRRVVMTPEIYLMLSGQPGEVGTDINLFRANFLHDVLTDADLRDIVGTNGDIRYQGCATGLAEGRSLEAEMGVSISFLYILKPEDLAP